jgi:osmoprotectant transport system substrate-binding protein
MRIPVAVSVAALALAALAGCSSSKSTTGATATTIAGGSTSVVIGSANFTENEVLADIYAAALTKAGVHVTTKLEIGSREVYFKEMENGTLNVFPEYNGTLLEYLDKSATATSTSDVQSALAKALPSSLECLNPSPAQDSDSITVTKAFATAHHLQSIGDLQPIESSVTVGGPPEFATRSDGIPGLRRVYGLTVNFKPLDEAGPLTVAALNDGTVQAADIFTTDPSIAKYNFVSLADPKHLFAAQNVTPIVNKSVATPTVVATLNAVSAALTTSDLIQLVNAVSNQHIDATQVAQQFVQQANLP